MRTIAPRLGVGEEVGVAEEQHEYLPCTATRVTYDDGSAGWWLRWTFTSEERAAIAAGADVYLSFPTRQVIPHNLQLRPDWATRE